MNSTHGIHLPSPGLSFLAVMFLAAGNPSGGLLGGGREGDDPMELGYQAKSGSGGGHGSLPVIPAMEGCTDNGNGSYTAWWGYFNKNAGSVTIPIGTRNKFQPAPSDRGQTTHFQPGNRDSAFSTTFDSPSLTWILDDRTASIHKDQCVSGCPFSDSLLQETWDVFNPSLWDGDGDQMVTGGYFAAQPLAGSAFADYRNPMPIALEANAILHFNQTFRLTYPLVQLFTQSAAVYMVNRDRDGTYENYAVVDIGYTGGLTGNRLYVEIFGADGGVGFDQFVITEVPASPDQTLNIDLRITRTAYSVAVNGTVVNTVNLATPLDLIDLVQVGVQRNLIGLEGRIDGTYLYKTCQ
jgi:hypothetical protein